MSINVPAGLTRDEYIRLVLESLEAAGITTKALKDIEDALADDASFICDVCERAECGGCDAEADDDDGDEAGCDEEAA
jgi:hypothetical protein